VVLSTDGQSSFTFFIYQDPNNFAATSYQVGFDAGDVERSRVLNIAGSDPSETYTENLTAVNIYRMDGE